jgi:Meckel syndrome type 1 protein
VPATDAPVADTPVPIIAGEAAPAPHETARVAPAPVPVALDPAPAPVIASAARTFAEAIHRAVTADDRARPADPTAPVAQPQATAAISAAAVTATGQAQQQTLDMRQPHWPAAMIQHIEKLRDMADANDMRIRVVPDALGAIDVALRREGDTVQVQLTAEQPETRAMLADAQPRLTEMAEARGLKLHHAQSGGTTAQGDRQPSQQQQQQRAAPVPVAPPSARRAATADADDTDQRLA